MKEQLTRRDISSITGVSMSSAARMLAECPFETRVTRGGEQRIYQLSTLVQSKSLPETAKLKLLTCRNPEPGTNNLPVKRDDDAPKQVWTAAMQENALAKADLLSLYLAYVGKAARKQKTRARKEFVDGYNTGIPYPKLFGILGKTHWKTIEGWKQKLKREGDTFQLADFRGYVRRGDSGVTPEQASILIRCAINPNRPLIAAVIRKAKAAMRVAGVPDTLSDATYRRFIRNFSQEYYDIWVFHREGAKAWNDKCAFYIERDYSLINVGDVLIADGHVLNFEVLNPFTGKPKRMTLLLWYDMKSSYPLGWEIMPTENTQAINAALRRAILRLGKIPKVVYLDNGRAFRSRFFEGCPAFDDAGLKGLYERLGINTIFAWPYHGQSKTVERFFGTLGEMERDALTYVGTSIATKPPRMHRGERLHRQVWEKVAGNACITLEQAHIAIAAWFDEYAARPQQSGHLQGLRPMDVFAEGMGPGIEDPESLYVMMMAQEIKHIRRNGIHFLGQNYYAPELYGWRKPVMIRYDLADPSYILVYDLDEQNKPMCVAGPVQKVHPAARHLGTEADQALLTDMIHFKKTQEKDASVFARQSLINDVLPEVRARAAQLGMDPERIIEGGKPAAPKQVEFTRADEDKIMREYKVLQAMNQPEDFWAGMDDLMGRDKYERVIEARVRDLLVPKQWQNWARYYEETPEYAKHAEYFENFTMAKHMEYQTATAANI